MKARLILTIAAVLAMTGCSVAGPESDSAQSAKTSSQEQSAPSDSTSASDSSQPADSTESDASVSESKGDKVEDPDNKVTITLTGSGAAVDSENASVSIEGSRITLTAAGAYTFKGKLDDGQILVNAPKTDKVEIYLDGVDIKSSASAPLRVEACGGCVIHLAEGSVNSFADTAANEFSACISAKDDLTIKGKGTLNVTGSAKHAIKTSNDLRIKNGTLNISAASTGLYGEDSVEITGGKITIAACKDGIKSKNEEDATRGTVDIKDAEIDVQNASGNGIEASLSVTVTSGSVKIHSLKQPVNCKAQDIAEGTVMKY